MAIRKRRKQRLKQGLIYFLTIVCSVLFIFFGHKAASQNLQIFTTKDTNATVQAKVVKVTDRYVEDVDMGGDEPLKKTTIAFEAKVLRGDMKGSVIEATQVFDPVSPVVLKEVAAGDRVMLNDLQIGQSGHDWILQEYIRTNALMMLGILFALLLLIFGKGKGFSTIVSLTFTGMALFMVFVPMILSGQNIYFAASLVCAFIVVMTLLLVNGANKKSLSAGIGCLGGLLASAGLVFIMDVFLKLTGVLNEESVYLLYMNPENPMDLKAIIFAAIIIGALGAVLDVSVSIASALNEIWESSEQVTFRSIVKSGMNIGRDVMGTMSNTLILAYIGSSLSVVLLLIVYNNSLFELLNREMIVVEILQTLVGSIGLLVTIPLTSIVCALIYTKKSKIFIE